MTRIAIIDHDNHVLYVEDIEDEVLKRYDGSEQAYIDDNFHLEHYSWDYIVSNAYYPIGPDKDPVIIDFEQLEQMSN